MNAFEKSLLNEFQRDFPLSGRPFAEIAARLKTDEETVINTFRRLKDDGKIGRIGAVIRNGSIGASTLAAMSVPAERLEEVAGLVTGYDEVNHNYEREHEFNLWFVVTAPDEGRIAEITTEIGKRAGLDVLNLPMTEGYHLDLGFDLQWM